MTQDLNQLRTTEDIVNALSVLYFNLNEIERIYYDMFLNPQEMDVTFQRYNDQGVLETITLPNRAKDTKEQTGILTGTGSPEGKVLADVGVFYIDTSTKDLYYKSIGVDSYGWLLLWSGLNLVEGVSYLAPNGNGSNLTNLNMSRATQGTLSVPRGGTGTGNITGIIKGNGTSAMSTAIEGTDFIGPNSVTGIICYYPVATIPSGWLMCDGAAYSRTTYSRLFSKIGTTYGSGNGSTTFNVPNLMDDGNGNPFFIRCWDGNTSFNTVQSDQVGIHKHSLSGNTGYEDAHTHTKGEMNITGAFRITGNGYGRYITDGAFYQTGETYNAEVQDDYRQTLPVVGFDASRSWEGTTSGGSAHRHSLSGLQTENYQPESGTETRVLNKMLVPIIKY